MKKYLFIFLLLCTQFTYSQIKPGIWRGELILHDTVGLPFNFEVKGNTAIIFNAEERIPATVSLMKNDSVLIRLPDFDAEIRASNMDRLLFGEFINLSRKDKNVITFRAFAETGDRKSVV